MPCPPKESPDISQQLAGIEASQRRMEATLRSISAALCAFGRSSEGCRSTADTGLELQGQPSEDTASDDDDSMELVVAMLPKGWPRTVNLRGIIGGRDSMDLPTDASGMLSTGSTRRRRISIHDVSDAGLSSARCTLFDWRLEILMDVLGLAFLLNDIVLTPYMLAWDLDGGRTMYNLMLCAAVFWTCHMWSCLSGVFDNGIGDDEPVRSSRARYLRSWFWLDCPLVLGDWASLAFIELTGSGDSRFVKIARLARSSKSLKMIALVKVVRSANLARFWAGIVDRSLSETYRIALRVLAIVCMILWLNHLVACAWHGIGTMDIGTESHWTQISVSTAGQEVPYLEWALAYQYTTAYHWAMAQTTLGAMEVSPTNWLERVFNIFCLLSALLCGSSLVSALSATMVEYHISRREQNESLSLLRRYLHEKCVSGPLAMRIQRQASRRIGEQGVLTANDVSALRIISQSLQRYLHLELCEAKLVLHPLFRTLRSVDGTWFEDFASGVVSIEVARGDDDIFFAGRPAIAAYYISSGTIAYTQEPASSLVVDEMRIEVEHGRWLSEHALWVDWVHVGNARAMSVCELMKYDPERFIAACNAHRVVARFAVEYGRLVRDRIRDARPPLGLWPTDVETPFTDFASIVASTSASVRHLVAEVASQSARANGGISTFLSQVGHVPSQSQHTIDLVEQAAREGLDLMPTGSGEPEAVQHLLACEVRDGAGRIFAQIAAWTGASARPQCRLPAMRPLEGKRVADCMERLLATKLHPIRHALSIDRCEFCVERLGTHFGIEGRRILRKIRAEFVGGDILAQTVPARRIENPAKRGLRRLQVLDSAGIQATERFLDREVFFVESCDEDGHTPECVFYAWLSAEELMHLQGPGEDELRVWARGLIAPEK